LGEGEMSFNDLADEGEHGFERETLSKGKDSGGYAAKGVSSSAEG
jgi:hypothetical protein